MFGKHVSVLQRQVSVHGPECSPHNPCADRPTEQRASRTPLSAHGVCGLLCRRPVNGCQRPLRMCLALCIAGALAAASFSGCRGNRGPERVVVSGTITHNGKPIPDGMIRFIPGTTSSMPTSGAIVKKGQYRADGLGGVAVGTYKIEIEAYQEDPHSLVPARLARGVARLQYLPKRFNSESPLQMTIESGSKEISKNFDLKD
jgi:hypothetical protein